jgi:prepilin-type N-terminal cleavage/methylation domain-containing protein
VTNARAFTLVELMVCLVLLALLSGLAVVSLGGARHAARAADVLAEVLLRDRLARETAGRFDRRIELRFDLTAGTVVPAIAASADQPGTSSDPAADTASQRPYTLPAGWRFGEVATATGAIATSGTLAVPCSAAPGGRSPSYEFVLIDPQGRPTCTLVVGPTGQPMEVPDATRARQTLAMLQPEEQGHDAD